MNTILLVAAGVVLGLLVFAIVKKLVRLALLLGIVLALSLFGWYAIEEAAPPGTTEKIGEAAEKVGKATGDAARKVGEKAAPVVEKAVDKAAPVAEKAAKAVADKAAPLVEKAAKKAAKAGAEIADKVADKVTDKVTDELDKLGQGDDDDSAPKAP